MVQDDAAQRARIGEAILHYVRKFPHAADTAEGILACWLPHCGFECAPDHIAAVLEDLVADRWLETRNLPDGKILYHLRGEETGGSSDTPASRSGGAQR